MFRRTMYLVVAAAFSLTAISACGGDDPDAGEYVQVTCNKMDECQLLSDPIMGVLFGKNASECKTRFKALISQGQNQDPTKSKCPAGQSVDASACLAAYDTLPCDDLKAGKTPTACNCS